MCPGSFDPITLGHLDVITRAAGCFDELVVGCTRNIGKRGLFGVDERVAMIEEVTTGLDNVRVEAFDGLLVDFCQRRDIDVIVKGVRAVSDFEYELQMAQMNGQLGEVETFFLTTSPVYSFLSSSLVKEVARFGGEVTDFVPEAVARRLAEHLAPRD